MVESQPTDFVVECSSCDLSCETDDLDDAQEFASKHREHTDHTLEWTTVNLDLDSKFDANTEWVVSCDVCDETWHFNNGEEAEDFQDEHASFTDHAPNDPVDTEEATISAESLKDIVRAYEEASQNGAPEALVLSHAEEVGLSESRAQRELDRLKESGQVYEVSLGYFQAM